MTGLTLLIAAIVALTALGVYLDHIGFDPFARYDTDPREAVDRAHRWDGGEE